MKRMNLVMRMRRDRQSEPALTKVMESKFDAMLGTNEEADGDLEIMLLRLLSVISQCIILSPPCRAVPRQPYVLLCNMQGLFHKGCQKI